MKSAAQVEALVAEWTGQGLQKTEIIRKTAEACLGWPYVWGASGQKCTPANRRAYAARDACPATEAAVIRSKCKALSGNGSCSGCKWYPDLKTTLIFDCRGFTRWLLALIGITLKGAGATSQWNTAANWEQKGEIADLPDQVCCLFMQNGKTMSHTGMYLGDGLVIHCSGEVKTGKPTDKGWTHWAIPKGLDGAVTPAKPTLRKGSKGAFVTLLQTKLIQLGYDLEPFGADGQYGAKTMAAVKQFQHDAGLQEDGVTGQRTWAALDEWKATTYTVTISHVSRAVADGIISKYGGVMSAEEG